MKEEIVSRRQFFKKTIKATLPIMGIIALGNIGFLSACSKDEEDDGINGCSGECTNSCKYTCTDSCAGYCGRCDNMCHSGCKGSCIAGCSNLTR